MAQKKWSAWAREEWAKPVPPAKISILPLENIGPPSLSVSDQALAATARTTAVSAWPVVDSEWRRAVVDGVSHEDRRDALVGWVLRVTEVSRWQGESTTVTWWFVPGAAEPALGRYLDLRWGDPTEEHAAGRAVEFWRVREVAATGAR